MPSPMRVPAGTNNAVKNSVLYSDYPQHDPTRIFEHFDDFIAYTSATDVPWVDTFVGTGTNSVLADEPFGAIAMVTTGADNDANQIQWQTENFTLATGKKAWFKTRLKVNDATQCDLLFGLAVLDTTLLGSTLGDGVTDGMFFYKDDDVTGVKFSCQKDATSGQLSPVSVSTLDTSYHTYGFEWDGLRYVTIFVDDVQVGTADLTTTASTYLPDTPVTISLAVVAGSAAARTMTVDYVLAAIER